jgi:hypothetical protein
MKAISATRTRVGADRAEWGLGPFATPWATRSSFAIPISPRGRRGQGVVVSASRQIVQEPWLPTAERKPTFGDELAQQIRMTARDIRFPTNPIYQSWRRRRIDKTPQRHEITRILILGIGRGVGVSCARDDTAA